MEEPEEINHATTSLKDRSSLLDLDIEKDFLASWKSLTVGESDNFDFDLTTVSKGNKKSFDFDQADMDFSLDGEFGKISAFNVDIPELDISPPSKENALPNEKTKESSCRSDGTKADGFAFAFDFDELGNFDLGSNVKSFGSNAQIEKDKKGFTYECREVKKDFMQKNPVTDITSIEDGAWKPFQMRSMMNFDRGSVVGRNEKYEQEEKGPCSNIAFLDVSAGTVLVQVGCEKSKISTESTMDFMELPPSNQSENLVSTKLVCLDREASVVKTCIQNFPSSLSGVTQGEGYSSETNEKVASVTKSDVGLGGELVLKLPATARPSSKLTLPESVNVITTDKKNENGVEAHMTEKKGEQKQMRFSSLSEKSSDTSAATGILYDAPSGMENQKPATQIFIMGQQTDASDINKEKKASTLGSTAGVQSEKNKDHSMVFSTPEIFSLLSTKRAGIPQPTLSKGRRGMCFVSGSFSVKKANDSSIQETEIMAKRKADPCQREMSIKDGSMSMELSKNALQNARIGTQPSSSPKTRNIPAEEKRFFSVAGRKKIPILCGLKLSGLNTDPAKSPNQKVLKSAGQFGPIRTSSRNMLLDTAHVLSSQKQTSSGLSMKRKTVEDGAISEHLSKRCFQSTPANRSPEEESEKYLKKKDASHHSRPEEDCIDTKIDDLHESLFVHHDDKIRVLEMTYSIEENSNVKQAEAYGKDLDDLCNMLRKKHDEAEDTLVEAIVNSNKLLLLLISPLFDQKISAARELMARLSLSGNDG